MELLPVSSYKLTSIIRMKNFGLQNVIMTIFVVMAVVALLVFSGVINIGSSNQTEARGNVTVWGTIPFSIMQKHIDQTKSRNLNVSYQVQDPLTYESDLINAIAAGRGPDLFIMPHEEILRNKDKIFEVSYENLPRRDYTDRYIRQSGLFLTDTGVLALPLSVDPLVMYYNKSLMSSAFILDVPQYWDEVLSFTPQITVNDANGRVSLSGAALGTFDNIESAKALLTTLMLQNGNRIVGTDPSSGQYRSLLSLENNSFEQTKQALEYYTSFANFGTANYSWNEALPRAQDMFIAGDLGLYFGRASELPEIRRKNPNLDFDVAFLPQLRGTTRTTTFGYMNGIAVSGQSRNVAGALAVAGALTGQDIAGPLSAELGEVPARIDLLRNRPEEAYLNLFYNSAIIADGWVDPDPDLTDPLIKSLIRNVNTGALSVSEAITRAHTNLNEILGDTINKTISNRNLEAFEG